MSNQNPYASGRMDAVNDEQIMTQLAGDLKRTQIVAGALVMGVLVFMGVVLVLIQGNVQGADKAGMLTWISGGFAGLMIMNHLLVPGIVVRQMVVAMQRESLTPEARIDRLGGMFRTQLIITLALLEGAAMFCLVTVIVEKNVVSLGMAVLLIILMAVRFPGPSRLAWWVQERLSETSF